jgi:hypothetical protein
MSCSNRGNLLFYRRFYFLKEGKHGSYNMLEKKPNKSKEVPAWTPEWLDMSALAYYLCTSKKQIQRMLASGRLPAADCNLSATRGVKGRRWRRQHIDEFLENRLWRTNRRRFVSFDGTHATKEASRCYI